MRQDVSVLREFYASSLGEVVRRMVSRKVEEAWGEGADLDILGLGYATPFLAGLSATARRTVAAMPSGQGAEAWPVGAPNRAVSFHEAALPLRNALFDRILAVHALEESGDPLRLLDEARRVMAPAGRIIVVVAARHGPWTQSEANPFGHGRSFSRRQLEALVREAQLSPLGWTRALYIPPISGLARWAESVESVGAAVWPPFAGVILMEAVKETFAVRPVGRVTPARAATVPILAPAPVGARNTRAICRGDVAKIPSVAVSIEAHCCL